jgi:Domain of unknown function (DUF4136)
MQTRMRQLALGMGLILAAGCAGQQVTTDYSPATSFSQFRTFALVSSPDTVAAQQLLDQRVSNAVQAQLTGKGLTATDRQDADLFVGYGMVDKTHREVYTDRDGWGWGGGWGWRYYRWGVAWPMTVQRRVETYTDGTVVVNLIDAKTKKVVWEGEIADAVSLPVGNPVGATKQIDGAVAKLFAKYPPQTSGA